MRTLHSPLVVEAAAAGAPSPLEEGEILFPDNYRCMHGRDPHEGDGLISILNGCATASDVSGDDRPLQRVPPSRS